MYCFHKGNNYVGSPLAGGAFSCFVCLYYIVGVGRFEFQAVIEKLLDIEHIFLVVVAGQLVVGMLSQIVLVGEKRPNTAQLQDALAAIHDSQLIPAHKLFATMSSDEFKNGKKILPFHLKRELNRELKAL